MKKSIMVYSDSGHGWGKVKYKELLKLNIQKEISNFSYMKNDSVYLEEDRDLSIYVKALKEIKNIAFNEINFIEKSTDKRSKIRNYELYNPVKINRLYNVQCLLNKRFNVAI